MREIKFRAWDKREKRMWWNVQNAYDTLHLHHTPDPEAETSDNWKEETFYPRSFGEVLRDENYSVMQFTGLHDKNGKEIYEGDIVVLKGEKYPTITEEIVFKNGCFVVAESGYYFWDYGFGGADRTVEVIGNIHENPEMMK